MEISPAGFMLSFFEVFRSLMKYKN